MINVVFKNLEKSELVQEAALDRAEALIAKFPDLRESRMRITLEMQNSPLQAGPDLFSVKFQIRNGRYGGVLLKKSDTNLYSALADVADHMLERLNRIGDRSRVIKRRRSRKTVIIHENLKDLAD